MLDIQKNVSLAEHTRFGIGGPADFFVSVKSVEELMEAIKQATANQWPWVLIGEGTNLLVADSGFRGLAIRVQISESQWDEENLRLTVGAGVNLGALIELVAEKGWTGMENMYGIPGTVGAGVYGNVGAYGTEIKDVLIGVNVLKNGEVVQLSNAECEFEYRSGIFKSHKDWFVLNAAFQFHSGDPVVIKQHMREILSKRLVKYPEGLKCPGSYFKNIKISELTPDQQDNVAEFSDKVKGGKLASGILLEAIGAKGMKEGDARVAEYHGNLIFNAGHAKASQVRQLAESLKSRVLEQFGITLEEEVQFIGDFSA